MVNFTFECALSIDHFAAAGAFVEDELEGVTVVAGLKATTAAIIARDELIRANFFISFVLKFKHRTKVDDISQTKTQTANLNKFVN
jgi:hypothetical protein